MYQGGFLKKHFQLHWCIINTEKLHICMTYSYIYIYMYVVVLVTQLCPTLWDPMDCSPPGSSLQGFLQERILEWVAIPFPGGGGLLPTQESKPGLLHCRQVLYHLSYCQIITTIKLINTSITSHSYHCFGCAIRTVKFYSLSKFQLQLILGI